MTAAVIDTAPAFADKRLHRQPEPDPEQRNDVGHAALATGGNGTLSYSISPALPTGLTFTAGTRCFPAPPTGTKASTTYTYTVTDADDNTASTDKDTLTFTIAVAADTTAPTVTSASSGYYKEAALTNVLAGPVKGKHGHLRQGDVQRERRPYGGQRLRRAARDLLQCRRRHRDGSFTSWRTPRRSRAVTASRTTPPTGTCTGASTSPPAATAAISISASAPQPRTAPTNALAAKYTHTAKIRIDTTAPTVTSAGTGYYSDAAATKAVTKARKGRLRLRQNHLQRGHRHTVGREHRKSLRDALHEPGRDLENHRREFYLALDHQALRLLLVRVKHEQQRPSIWPPPGGRNVPGRSSPTTGAATLNCASTNRTS